MDDRSTITYLERREIFYDRELLQRFLQGLARQGFYVAGSDQSEVRRTRLALLNEQTTNNDRELMFSPVISPALERDIDAFVGQNSSRLTITLFTIERKGEMQGFEATFTLSPASYTIFSVLYGNRNVLAHYKRWLSLHRYMYTTWHPLYSYNDTGGAIPDTSRAEILAGELEWLYEINLFSSPLVEKLGRERLLNTPAWLVEGLEDGSIFFVPELTYNGGEEEDYVYSREEIARQLGLRADEFERDMEDE